nr:hypothetical protein [Streptomyces sp. EAS-AB2608]
MRRRVRGADHDQLASRLDRRYAELVGGLLDGPGWTQDEVDTSVALPTELGRFGVGGRAMYDPRPGDPGRWNWTGDTP